jgi:cytidyltransferase-like protein
MTCIKARLGSIHGRFQPFHNGHLAYAMAALNKVETIYVGLTRVLSEPGIGADVAPHRLESSSNPLSYFQRVEVVRAALMSEGIAHDRFQIGPFPIEDPSRLNEFWPLDLPCYTTVVDDWNRLKIRELQRIGYVVEILDNIIPDNAFVETGTSIRQMIRNSDASWQKFVPTGTIDLIERFRSSF